MKVNRLIVCLSSDHVVFALVPECGGRYTSSAGSFAYPLYANQTYDHGVNCGWVITVNANKVMH